MSGRQQSTSFWKRRISRGWLIVPLAAVLLVAAAGGTYFYLPAPSDLLGSMWPLRTEVLAAVRSDSPRDALPSIDKWDQAASRLPLALRLHGQAVDAETKQRIDALRQSLAGLRESIEKDRRDEIPSRAVDCFEAHRLCAALFEVAPPASVLARHDHGSHAHAAAGDLHAAHAESAAHAGHEHGRHEIGPGEPVPTVGITVVPDLENKGWNLRTETTKFRFAPERASGKHLPGEGHAHLYVDGNKVTRLYGEWHFLGTLPPGRHTVRVTLNTNDHNDYVHNGEVIAAETVVDVPGASGDDELCRYPVQPVPGPSLAKEVILFGAGDSPASSEGPPQTQDHGTE